ncbi:MAG: Antibiotic biosynthesis monooxygenase [Chloroflexota bacterium]|nr:Antibiotic biosynthesis monooxygenase [Chloroflexota bacterium]
MYLVRTELLVRPGGAKEFEETATRLGQARKGQPGNVGQTLLHSYGSPSKYALISRWENAAAQFAWQKSDAFTGIVTALQVTPLGQSAYESVFEVDAPGMDPTQGHCEVLVDWTLDQRPGVVSEFERTRRELFELRRQVDKACLSSRLRRSAGSPFTYLGFSIYTNAEAARAGAASPQFQAFQAAHPYTLYASTPPNIEAFEVVHRM